jgi:hypothetical protein
MYNSRVNVFVGKRKRIRSQSCTSSLMARRQNSEVDLQLEDDPQSYEPRRLDNPDSRHSGFCPIFLYHYTGTCTHFGHLFLCDSQDWKL